MSEDRRFGPSVLPSEDDRVSQYPWSLLAVYVVTVGGVQLLALWVATSTKPWLLRATIVWVPIALLLPIRAYEPALLLTFSAMWTVFIELGAQYCDRTHQANTSAILHWRFRVADLLVLILLLATLLGTALHVVEKRHVISAIHFYALLASPIAIITLLAYRTVVGPYGRLMLLSLFGAIWVCALFLRAINFPLYLGHGPPSLGTASSSEEAYWATMIGALPLVLASCVALPLVASRATRSWFGAKTRRLILAAAIGVSLVVGIATACLVYDAYWMTPRYILKNRFLETAIHSIVFFGLASFVALGAVLARLGWGEAAGWPRKAARAAMLLVAVFVGAPAGWIYWQMLKFPSFPSVDYGRANNYDRIMDISRPMKGYLNSTVSLPPSLRKELDEAAILLRASNYVPVKEMEADPKTSAGLPTFDWLSLSQQLSGACVDAAKSRQTDRAADYAIAVVRCGTMFERGWTSGYVWAARGTQEFGYQRLAMFRGELSAAKAREIIRLLHQSLRERDDLALLLARDQVALARTGHWSPRLENVLQKLSTSDAPPEHAAPLEESRKRMETLNRLLQADLAIRLFQRDHGRKPESLAELVTEYLPELPTDPYSDQPLIYRPSGGECELYSVGPDGKDDGGYFLDHPPRDVNDSHDVRLLQLR